MPKTLPPHIEVHLHKTETLTLDVIDGFADADRLTQVQVLAVLRERANPRADALVITAYGLALGFLGLLVAPATFDLTKSNPLVSSIVGLAVGVFGVIVLLPVLIPLIWRRNKAELASRWLHVYEAEIARRHSLRGAAGRRWRKTH